MNLTRRISKLFLNFHRFSCSIHKIPVVKVLTSENDDNIRLSFKYAQASNLTVRAHKKDDVHKLLRRIQLIASLQQKKEEIRRTVMNKYSSTGQVALQENEEDTTVYLIQDGNIINGNISNIEALTLATQLKIGELVYDVKFNLPTVVGLGLPKYILVGCSFRPKFRLECCDVEDCNFTWYRSQPKDKVLNLLNSYGPENVIIEESKCWLKVGEGFVYTTSSEDVGCFLKVVCIPKQGKYVGDDYSLQSITPVVDICDIPFEKRQKHTKTLTDDDSIRCVSYNTLANSYVEKKKFPYCSEKARDIQYRKQMLLRELTGYNSDILCLQEVEERVFKYDLALVLKDAGFEGFYKKKGGRRSEGLATFFRSSKFKLLHNYGVLLTEVINDDIYKDLKSKVGTNNKDISRLLNQESALQISLLQDVKYPDRKLLVANTHLYSNKDSPEVRFIQAAICTNYMQNIMKEKELDSAAILFCGDFNSFPTSDTYDFMTSGKSSLKWKNNSSSNVDTVLSHNLDLGSACGAPDYTNYTEEFNGCLDYIFYSKKHLKVTEIVPMPEHKDIIAEIGLPNEYFPSDHLALICTLKWNDT